MSDSPIGEEEARIYEQIIAECDIEAAIYSEQSGYHARDIFCQFVVPRMPTDQILRFYKWLPVLAVDGIDKEFLFEVCLITERWDVVEQIYIVEDWLPSDEETLASVTTSLMEGEVIWTAILPQELLAQA
jgi:hypothetical protein